MTSRVVVDDPFTEGRGFEGEEAGMAVGVPIATPMGPVIARIMGPREDEMKRLADHPVW